VVPWNGNLNAQLYYTLHMHFLNPIFISRTTLITASSMPCRPSTNRQVSSIYSANSFSTPFCRHWICLRDSRDNRAQLP
jgi:hypothetical protein